MDMRRILQGVLFFGDFNPSPWSRILEKLMVDQLVKKFLTFCTTQSLVSAFTKAHHWILS
jgi:endonuclease/exonuclease/phosphatase (EEP) superfamily protein YafD